MLKHAATIISISLASLYAVGLSFYQGYLSGLGIEETQFPLAIDRVFFQGFVSSVMLGIQPSFYLFVVAAIAPMTLTISYDLYTFLKRYDVFNEFLSIFKPKKQYKAHPLIAYLSKVSLGVLLFVTAIYAAFVIVHKSHVLGEEQAKNTRARLLAGELPVKKVYLKKDGNVLKGVSIVCNGSQCAYLTKINTIIINTSDIDKVESLSNES